MVVDKEVGRLCEIKLGIFDNKFAAGNKRFDILIATVRAVQTCKLIPHHGYTLREWYA